MHHIWQQEYTTNDPFFEDSRIQLDNKAIENKIRPLALGGKTSYLQPNHFKKL
jgi:hypothetical protein